MPRENIIMECTVCKGRNYFTTKNRRKHPERAEWKKYCPRCNALHRVRVSSMLQACFGFGRAHYERLSMRQMRVTLSPH